MTPPIVVFYCLNQSNKCDGDHRQLLPRYDCVNTSWDARFCRMRGLLSIKVLLGFAAIHAEEGFWSSKYVCAD